MRDLCEIATIIICRLLSLLTNPMHRLKKADNTMERGVSEPPVSLSSALEVMRNLKHWHMRFLKTMVEEFVKTRTTTLRMTLKKMIS